MGQLFNVLAISLPDWEIPWAGIGTFLLGAGGCLSGIAAVITARNRGRNEATTSTVVSRTDDDGGSGVSGSGSAESGDSSSTENSDD
jgi:hypothetical protein